MKTLTKAIMIYRRFTSHEMTETSQGIVGIALGRRGYTLVELIVVCAIIGILVAMAIPAFDMIAGKAKEARCVGEIRGLETDISAYSVDNGTLPPLNWAGIRRGDLKDPWGKPYEYDPVAKYKDISGTDNANTDYDLYSKGKDGDSLSDMTKQVSQDDVVRASDGSYLGLVTKFNP